MFIYKLIYIYLEIIIIFLLTENFTAIMYWKCSAMLYIVCMYAKYGIFLSVYNFQLIENIILNWRFQDYHKSVLTKTHVCYPARSHYLKSIEFLIVELCSTATCISNLSVLAAC